MTALLTRLLARLTDRALAESIVGDLEEQRRSRSTAWFVAAAVAVVAQVAWQALRQRPRSLRSFEPRTVAVEARQAFRSLARTPATTAVVVATLALGLGVNTAVFSVVHGILFDPLPFAAAERLAFIEGTRRGEPPSVFGTSYPDYLDIAREQRSFDALATTAYWTFTLTGTETPLRLVGLRVSGTFFPMLGMPPELGRWIGSDDDRTGGPEVVVIAHSLWQRVFGGDETIVGRRVTVNGRSAEVIGVMPASFTFPFEDAELWAPMLDEMSTVPRNSRFFTTIGRLRAGVTLADAQREMSTIAAALERVHPDSNRDWRPAVTGAVRAITKDARPRLLLIFGAVVVVLLVACINVASILVMRMATREHALRVRVALGAGRWQLGRVLLLESAWLAGGGLCAALLVAAPAVAALKSLAPDELPRVANISLSLPVLTWAAAAMIAFTIVGALAPLASVRVKRLSGVRSATVAGGAPGWGRRIVAAVQIAGAFVLLAAAGLLLRSFTRVLDVDPGFNPHQLVTVRVFLTPPAYRTLDQQLDYVRRGLESLRGAPGVRAVAAISQPPFDREGGGTTLAAAVEGRTYAPGSHPVVAYRLISPEYFSTAGVPILEGRALSADDRRGAPLAGVINRAMAEALWPGERPIGRRFEFADGRNAGWITVVGVAGDVATDGLETREPPAVYAPYVQRSLSFLRWMTFVVRTDGDAAAAIPMLRARLQQIDPRQPLYSTSTMAAAMATSTAERRFAVVLMAIFAGLTLVLAALGVYGMLAQGVAARRRELGVRLALGAVPRQVFRLVVTEGARLVAAGLLIGAVAAALAAPLLRDALFGVTPFDVPTYAVIVFVLAGAACFAGAVPAMSAARTDPVGTLRDG